MAESQTKKRATRNAGEQKQERKRAAGNPPASRKERTERAVEGAKRASTSKATPEKKRSGKGTPTKKAKPTPKKEQAPKRELAPKQEYEPIREPAPKKDVAKAEPAAEMPPPLPVNVQLNQSRTLWGIVFLLLSIFSALCWFDVEGWLIVLLNKIERGLTGWGWWATPMTLLLTSGQFFFHKGKPVRLRVLCCLMIPAVLGTVAHILAGSMDIQLGLRAIAELWNVADTGYSGGVLGGFAAVMLSRMLGRVGAFLFQVLLVAMIIMVLTRTTPEMLVGEIKAFGEASREAFDNRPEVSISLPKLPKLPIPDYDEEDIAEEDDTPDEDERSRTARAVRQKRPLKDYDIPMDESMEEIPQEWDEPIRERDRGYFEPTGAERMPDADMMPAEAFVEEDDSHFFDAETGVSTPSEYLQREGAERAEKAPRRAKRATVARQPVAVGVDEYDAFAEDEEGQMSFLPTSDHPKRKTAVAKATQPAEEQEGYQFPSVELLGKGNNSFSEQNAELELKETEQELAETIQSFGIDGEIIGSTRGPSVTRYDLRLERGVKLSKVTNLSKDIALSLGVVSVRIAPVTGKNSIVGIEVPNRLVSNVPIRSVIESEEFQKSSSKLAFAVGKDIANHNIVGDISRMPHLLIAGTTGSGKSVCTNSMIISLLYKYSPEDVRLIMVDPKMVELNNYNGIPHLLIPVVTDPKKAAGALQWAVYEMMQRYQDFSIQGVRDLESFNALSKQHEELNLTRKPKIVVFIDELADLMLVAAKEVEESICRVAQMGRAAGIHLVIATQRPSSDVITGLMKANIPSRIALAVASSLDSRIILDVSGAEDLVGNGDMLFAPLGKAKRRVQGCYISDDEVNAVIEAIKQNSAPNYDSSISQQVEENALKNERNNKGGASAMNVAPPDSADAPADDRDALFQQAVDVVVELQMASASTLQRKLKIGYARAARLIDQLEEYGYIGAFEGSKPRKVLVSKERWEEKKMQSGTATALDESLRLAQSMSADADADLPPFD